MGEDDQKRKGGKCMKKNEKKDQKTEKMTKTVKKVEKAETVKKAKTWDRSAAAKKAWITIRAKKAAGTAEVKDGSKDNV